MKRCKKWLALISAFTFIATSSLIPGTYEVQAATGLTPAAGKTIGNSNPLITHKYGADPFAMVYNGRVYIYLTDDQAQWELTPDTNNSYSNCRSISIISSADMVNWTDHGKVPIGKQLSNGLTTWASNAWAPAAAWKKINGKDKFFLYFADSANGIGVLTGDSPIGPFHDPLGHALINRQNTPNVESSKVPWLFDPAVLVDDDGKAYLYFGGGIDGLNANNPKSSRVVQLGDDMISIVGTPQEIDAPRIFEDSGIHKFNGKYYYSYCSNFSGTNGEGYPPTGTIAYMVSDNPLGPFTYIGPILPGPGVFGNGDGGNNHHAIFEFEGKWYITYHTRQVNIAKRLLEGKSGHRDYRSPSITELSIDNATGLITPLQMENKGVSRLKTMNPYTRVEAETIAWNGGISTEVSTQPGSMVDSINLQVNDINNGDWIAVSGLDFGDTGAGTFTANVASGSSGGEIELRLDSPEGQVIGTLPVSSTGGWDNWEMMTTAVSGATGVHDLYMIFKGQAEGDLFKVDYWKFNQKSDNHELVSINATIDKQKIDITSGNNTANITVTAVYADGTSEDVTDKAIATPSQSGIVEINKGLVTGVGYGTTNISISYEGKTDVVYIEVKDLKAEYTVKKLTVDKNHVTLDSGSNTTFKVTAEYFDGHTEDVTNKATYNNLHSDIADVANGTITAKASGTTNIIISFRGELGDAVTTQIYVTVSNLSAPVKFLIKNCNPVFEGPCKVAWGDTIGYFDKGTNGNPDGAVTFTVNVPKAGQYKMSVYNVCAWGSASHLYTINGDTDNTIRYTYPSDSTEWKLSPFSQDITLNAGDNTIRIAANSGVAELQYIILQSYSGEGTHIPISGVSLDKYSISMKAGDVDTLVATVDPSTATDKEVAFVVEGSAVTVAEAVYNENDGTTSVQIKAEKQGSAIVKAYAGGFESICNVTVSEDKVNVTGLTLDKSKLNLQEGSTGTLVATITPANATNKTVTFASDNESVATVTGVVYDEVTGTTSVTVNALTAGTATITATTSDGNKTATCDVTVIGTEEEELKPFTIITDGMLDRVGGIQADVQVSPTQGIATHDGEEAVVFQLMKGNTPVSIPALMRDITSTESIKAYFNVEPTDTSYTVKVFVLDRFDSDVTAPVSLAESVILK